MLDAGEACEDGNTTNGDGCDDTCAIESGWDCTGRIFELDFITTSPKMDTLLQTGHYELVMVEQLINR